MVSTEEATCELVTAEGACEIAKISEPTLNRMVKRGDFPLPVRVGPRMKRWRLADINAWVANLNQVAEAVAT